MFRRDVPGDRKKCLSGQATLRFALRAGAGRRTSASTGPERAFYGPYRVVAGRTVMSGDYPPGGDEMAGTTPLLGRDREVATAEQAVRAALTGTPAVVVVAGDAGIGKSTLVRAVADRASRLGVGVGVGVCLDVSSQRPQGPVVEAMRQLGAPTAAGDVTEVVRAVAERVAQGPVLMVLEDLQWAESGTRDVVRTLAHTMDGRLMLLATVRTEDVPRSHPAGDLVRDVTRSPRCTVIELDPLDESAMRLLAAQRLGADPGPDLGTRLHQRSEGNPLYAEELLDAGSVDDEAGLPPRLADLFLARVDRLPDLAATTVLRAASAIGTRVDQSLLVTTSGLRTAVVTRALKEARDRRLLVVRNGELEFRHALLRDALYEDLLPAERTELHGRLAQELQRRSEVAEVPDIATLGSLSFHAERAGDAATALLASVRAGLTGRSQGTGDAVEHLVRALDLWERAPDPENLTAVTHAELLLMAGQAATAHADVDQARSLLRAAVEEAEAGADRLLLSRAYAAYAVNGTWAGDPLSEQALPAALEAAGPGPSSVRADALIPSAFNDFLFGRLTAATRSAREILAIGTSLGDIALQACGHAVSGFASIEQGYVSQGVADVRLSIAEAARAHTFSDSLFFEAQLAWLLAEVGPSGQALDVAQDAARRARELRLPGGEVEALEQVAEIRLWRGELDAAAGTYEEMRRSGLRTHRLGWISYELLLARGDLDGALVVLGELSDDELIDEPPPDVDGFVAGIRTELHLARGDLAPAAESALKALTANDGSENVTHRAVVAAYGYLVLRALADKRLPQPAGLALSAARMLQECLDAPPKVRTEWARSVAGAFLPVARACASALAGDTQPELWQSAVDILDETGYALWRIRVQVHLAEDLWAAGDRAAARTVLHDTWHEANRIGAGAVAASSAAVARRHHISLPGQPLSRVHARLTPREREVLALIEDGATNRQIAQALVISEKTVSVHVSNLLGKLGAAHRGEAVAMARRARG